MEKGHLSINNHPYECISIDYENMTEIETKQVIYYLLRSDEWKVDRLSFDEEPITMMDIKIDKRYSTYNFDVVYQCGTASKVIIRKTIKDGICLARVPKRLSYFLSINEEVNGIKLRCEQVIIEEYEVRDGNLTRIVSKGAKREILDEKVESLKFAIDEFDNISLSHLKKSLAYTKKQ